MDIAKKVTVPDVVAMKRDGKRITRIVQLAISHLGLLAPDHWQMG